MIKNATRKICDIFRYLTQYLSLVETNDNICYLMFAGNCLKMAKSVAVHCLCTIKVSLCVTCGQALLMRPSDDHGRKTH